MDFNCKMVGSRRVLYVMATSQEYGPALKRQFEPLVTGVGPVEAGVVIGAALAQSVSQNKKPDLVVSLGSAGSNCLKQAEIYQASHVSYRDMDASALGFEKGVTPFLDLPATIEMPLQLADVPAARLSTGGNIVSGEAYTEIDADMVDMESYAIARTCSQFDVPLICLRGISDGVKELSHVGDWTQYLHIIDEKLAETVEIMERNIVSGHLLEN